MTMLSIVAGVRWLRSCTDSPDFIVVRDGVDASSPVIAQYCNTQRAEQVVSTGPHLYVDFIVDGQRQRNGFEATYEFVVEASAVLGTTDDDGHSLETAFVDTPPRLKQKAQAAASASAAVKEVVPSYHAGTPVHSPSVSD